MGHSLVPMGASAIGPATVQAQAGREKAALLKPNLVVLKAADMYIAPSGSDRYLRFESSLGNIGRGPVEVRPNNSQPCPRGKHHATQVLYRDVDGSRYFRRSVDTEIGRRSAGCMLFHPQHDHWHFEAASRYTLFQPGEEKRLVRVVRRKMSFCLRDSRPIPDAYGEFHQPDFYGECSKYSPQGISTGWVDVYQSFLDGQALRLPKRTRDGFYCLQIKVDPTDQLLESNEEDNSSMRAFVMKGNRVTFRPGDRCR